MKPEKEKTMRFRRKTRREWNHRAGEENATRMVSIAVERLKGVKI